MPIIDKLPFELDTLEAIQDAQGKKNLIIAILTRVGPFVFYLICAICEYVAFNSVNSKMDITCIEYYEISDAAVVFLLSTYIPLIPDAFFAILGPISIFMLYNNPFGVFYNGVIGLVCLVSGAYFHAHMTFCGNPQQDAMIIGPLLQYLSGFVHIANCAVNHISFMYLDKEGELYFGPLQDCFEDVTGKGK